MLNQRILLLENGMALMKRDGGSLRALPKSGHSLLSVSSQRSLVAAHQEVSIIIRCNANLAEAHFFGIVSGMT